MAHDTFARILASRDALAAVREPRAFLSVTASRLIIDQARRRQVEEAYLAELSLAMADHPGAPSPEQILMTSQALAQLSAILEGLAEPGRDRSHGAQVPGVRAAALLRRGGRMSAVGSQDIAREAAQWLMRLTEDDASPADRDRLRAGFDAWKRQDPRHDPAARRMEAVLTQLGALRDDAAGQTTPLHAGLKAGWAGGRQRRIRRVAAALALAAALATPLAVFLHFYPSTYLLADMRSGAGQWQTHVLADQSRVTLEPGTAVNLHFDPQRREVELAACVRWAPALSSARNPA
ncbi:hypothetical protein G6F31_014873 [Rhizopus arrhizus]|nr:hypothetical protein G6F31_014873 [Rhizopus arrhizus]